MKSYVNIYQRRSKGIFLLTSILLSIFLFNSCKSSEKKEDADSLVDYPFYKESREKLFSQKPSSDEVFQIFITSEEYTKKQVAAKKTIALLPDKKGDLAFQKAIEDYNKIQFFAHGVVRLELYPGMGRLKSIRFVNPSGIGEIDKLISEDVTRWKYKFPEGVVTPLRFNVRYGVALRKNISREEALKELKKYAR